MLIKYNQLIFLWKGIENLDMICGTQSFSKSERQSAAQIAKGPSRWDKYNQSWTVVEAEK